MTWWSEWRVLYFELSTLGTAAAWDTPIEAHRIYSDGSRSFHEKEIGGQFDELEEQLWAIRHNLA